jgi:CRP-like cAMP-binding protein
MDNIALLLKVFFFKNLEPDELLGIMAVSRRENYTMGQKVFTAGSPSDAFYIVKQGSVMVKNGPMVLATLGIGDTIGEMSFVDHGERSATVAAIEATELLKIPFDTLEKLFDEHPRMAMKVYRSIATVLSQRLRDMDEVIRTKYQPLKC